MPVAVPSVLQQTVQPQGVVQHVTACSQGQPTAAAETQLINIRQPLQQGLDKWHIAQQLSALPVATHCCQ